MLVVAVAVVVSLTVWCYKAKRGVSKAVIETTVEIIACQGSGSSDVAMQESPAYAVEMMRQPTNNDPVYEVVM